MMPYTEVLVFHVDHPNSVLGGGSQLEETLRHVASRLEGFILNYQAGGRGGTGYVA